MRNRREASFRIHHTFPVCVNHFLSQQIFEFIKSLANFQCVPIQFNFVFDLGHIKSILSEDFSLENPVSCPGARPHYTYCNRN